MIADIIVASVLVISALISFFRGFIREVLTIIGVVGGVAAAYFLGPKFTPIVSSWFGIEPDAEDIPKLFDLIPMDMVAMATAYGLIFLIVVILLSVISHFLAAGAKAIGLGPLDRTFGVVFGIARAILLLGLLYLPAHIMMSDETKTDLFGESKTHLYVEKTAQVLSKLLPDSDDGTVLKTAEDSFKESLMEQDLLKQDRTTDPEKQTQPNANGQEGYQDNQRDELEDLFRAPYEQERPYNE